MKLAGKVAIVTGGSSGIGRATSVLFAREGASVTVVGRDVRRGEETVRLVREEGGRAVFIPADVTREDDCRRAVETAVREFGRLDILFNNAGVIFRNRTAVETSLAEWEETMAVNVRGAFLMSKYAIPLMAVAGGGVIVNNASYFGLVGGRGVAAYCASKGAVVQLTRAMALDHAAQNIRVNCVCPGSVDTPMISAVFETSDDPERIRCEYRAKHPLGRVATPEEVARAVLYLTSNDSSFVTGASLPVDGGITAG